MKKQSAGKMGPGLALASLTVSGVCLGTSLWQAKIFINGSMGNGGPATVMVLGVCGALLGSQVIARLTGHCIRTGSPLWCALLGLFAIAVIEGLSVGISTISFDGNLLASSRETNLTSPEYRQYQENIELYRSQIRSIQKQAESLPANYVTRRQELNQSILDLQGRVMAEQAAMKQVSVATSDQAFNRLASTTGITQEKIALIMGLLLSLVPMTINLLSGSLNWEEQAVKKPSSKKKKAVASALGKLHAVK